MTADVRALLDAIEALARAATPGPWHYFFDDYETGTMFVGPLDEAIGPDAIASGVGRSDAAYIAALSPDVVLRLVAMARESERLREVLQPFVKPGAMATDPDGECYFCAATVEWEWELRGPIDDEERHTFDCPIETARAALAAQPAGDGG